MKSPALIALSLLLINPEPARAGWFSNLGDAFANVITFGDVGRRRDHERAEREAAAMNERRAAKEAEKASQIGNISQMLRIAESTREDFQFINLVLNEINLQYTELAAYLDQNVTNKTWLGGFFRRWSTISAEDQKFDAEVLTMLDEAAGVDAAADGEDRARRKENLLRTKDAIDRLRATARTHEMELNQMLAQVLSRVQQKEAQTALAKITIAGQKLGQLKTYVEERSKENENRIASYRKQIEEINAVPLPPPAAPVPPFVESPAPPPPPRGSIDYMIDRMMQ